MQKFSKEYLIRSYECDKDGFLRMVTLMNIFQDMADTHAGLLGLGLDFCLEKGLAWVGANYRIIIERLPKLHEKISVETWPAVEQRLGAIRDFLVYDESGKVIIRASSQWILINFEKKRPVGLRENLPQYQIIEERSIDGDFEKMESVGRIDCQRRFLVRYDDIDFNKHVNNAVYPLWALEAIDYGFRDAYQVQDIEIAFKKECKLGEEVNVATEVSGLTTLHSITSVTDGRELAGIRIRWKSR